MRIASLFDCFNRHLENLDIVFETQDLFIEKVLEDYILNMCGSGFTMGEFAEEIYEELQLEVTEMLQKRIYGHYDINSYRSFQRSTVPNAS